MFVSIEVDSQNRPIIAYNEGTNGDLKLARSADRLSFTTTTLESKGSVGLYCSVAVNSQDQPVIAYYNLLQQDQG